MASSCALSWCLGLLLVAMVGAATYGPIAIEIKVENFENPHGIRADGRRCDWFSSCDHSLHFHIDTASANEEWPGSSRPIAQWFQIEAQAQKNLVPMNKVLVVKRNESEYITDGDSVLVNLRVLAEDLDDITRHDLIERFDCGFRGIPAQSLRDASWSPPLSSAPLQCHGELHFNRPAPQRPTLYYRYRLYKTEIASMQTRQAGDTGSRPGWQRIKNIFGGERARGSGSLIQYEMNDVNSQLKTGRRAQQV